MKINVHEVPSFQFDGPHAIGPGPMVTETKVYGEEREGRAGHCRKK